MSKLKNFPVNNCFFSFLNQTYICGIDLKEIYLNLIDNQAPHEFMIVFADIQVFFFAMLRHQEPNEIV